MGARSSGPSVVRVGWSEVRRFRLARQQLVERAPTAALVDLLGRIGGVQAQLVSAAQVGLWNRVRDLDRSDLEARVDSGRSIVKAWCMRRTLHLLPARDLSLFVRGTAPCAEKEVRWLRGKGFSDATFERLAAAGGRNAPLRLPWQLEIR